ncbi:MAG TPA: hypothetical protein PK159_04745 [Steroidobacteraceae bacterium]|nr:hypothetical protein [Steroidobacteraceae bacterium]
MGRSEVIVLDTHVLVWGQSRIDIWGERRALSYGATLVTADERLLRWGARADKPGRATVAHRLGHTDRVLPILPSGDCVRIRH